MSEKVKSKKLEDEKDISFLKERVSALEKRISISEKRITVHDNILGQPIKSPFFSFSYPKEPKTLIMSFLSEKLGEKYKMTTNNKLENECLKSSFSNSESEEVISPWQFLKRMYLIAYACFKYPFRQGDVYIDYNTGQVIHESDLTK